MCYLSLARWRGVLLSLGMLLALALGACPVHAQSRSLIIQVLDDRTGEPLPGAVGHIGRRSMQTDLKGQLTLALTGSEEDGLHVHLIGYHEGFIPLDKLRSTPSPFTLRLRPEDRDLSSVKVVGNRRPVSANVVSTKVSTERIERNLGRNLASLLTEVSGVTSLQTGTTTAKPVIHGMYGTRVLIVNNGVRQSGQQWGDDHAPEVSVDANDQVHVVKGAEAVAHGSEALAGVIILGQSALPYRGRALQGTLATSFATNGRRFTEVAKLEGALLFLPSLAWRAQLSYTNAGDRSTAKYLLTNTGVKELDYSLALGWRGEHLSLESYFSQYQNKTGLLPSGHLKNANEIEALIERGRPLTFRPFSRHIDYPHHDVLHRLWSVKGRYDDEHLGTFTLQTSLQTDRRDEYNIRRNDRSSFPTLALDLKSFQADAAWRKHYHRWDTELGLHFVGTENYNRPGTGVVPIIPNYTEVTGAAHLLQKYQAERWGAEVGLRLDQMTLKVAGYDIYQQLFKDTKRFTNLTYSIGGHCHLSPLWHVTTNLGAAFRAPHVHELYSEGNQHGSAIYIRGNRNLKSERGYKWITSVEHSGERLHVRADGYLQWIDGYIFDAPTHTMHTTLSGEYPFFTYQQRDAFFRGFDIDASYRFPQDIEYGVKSFMVWANERGTGQLFPYIPSFHLGQHLSWSPKLGGGFSGKVTLNHLFVARQTRFDSAIDIADAPPAYGVWGAEVELSKTLKNGQSLRLLLTGDNLLNAEYKEYTNRARYYAHEAGRDIRASLLWKF